MKAPKGSLNNLFRIPFTGAKLQCRRNDEGPRQSFHRQLNGKAFVILKNWVGQSRSYNANLYQDPDEGYSPISVSAHLLCPWRNEGIFKLPHCWFPVTTWQPWVKWFHSICWRSFTCVNMPDQNHRLRPQQFKADASQNPLRCLHARKYWVHLCGMYSAWTNVWFNYHSIQLVSLECLVFQPDIPTLKRLCRVWLKEKIPVKCQYSRVLENILMVLFTFVDAHNIVAQIKYK